MVKNCDRGLENAARGLRPINNILSSAVIKNEGITLDKTEMISLTSWFTLYCQGESSHENDFCYTNFVYERIHDLQGKYAILHIRST